MRVGIEFLRLSLQPTLIRPPSGGTFPLEGGRLMARLHERDAKPAAVPLIRPLRGHLPPGEGYGRMYAPLQNGGETAGGSGTRPYESRERFQIRRRGRSQTGPRLLVSAHVLENP